MGRVCKEYEQNLPKVDCKSPMSFKITYAFMIQKHKWLEDSRVTFENTWGKNKTARSKVVHN